MFEPPLNVLYLVSKAVLGGHVLSAYTIARRMREYGINPIFAGGDGDLSADIRSEMPFESVSIPFFHRDRHTYYTWNSLQATRAIRQLINRHDIDLVHAFDARAYMHAFPAGVVAKRQVMCTLCGGTDPYYDLPRSPVMMVFSEEQKHRMTNAFGWQEQLVDVVRTRLDLNQLTSSEHILSDGEVDRFGISHDLENVMMISSFDSTKIQSIYQVLDAAEIAFSNGSQFQLTLIGGKGNGYEGAKRYGAEIGKRHPHGNIVFTGPVMHAFRMLQRADLVIGVGRSAFEGMAYSKPTIIVGENGYAGVVSQESVEQIGWFNFSGRNQNSFVPPEELASVLQRLLQDKNRRNDLGQFSRGFVFKEIDVARGTDRIADAYQKVVSEPLYPRWARWASFGKSLVPVARDNGIHYLKTTAKALLRHGKTSVNS